MSKNKLQKFSENRTFPNLFQYGYEDLQQAEFSLKGKWGTKFFRNRNPLILELGCGKGEYTIGLAQRYPEKNFIGVDIKGARLWKGLNDAKNLGLSNVAFIRTRIELIEAFFGSDEVAEIWITFPDPQPQKSRQRKRLTHPLFLNRYRNFLQKDGLIHLKTDSELLYEFTKEVIAEQGLTLYSDTADLYATTDHIEVKTIRTFYEDIWLKSNLSIKYLCFSPHHEC
ncbi:MAG: tRNA (guanosine(46)-N7)-methyltransferase TrmB [Bacteroidales bacterium]|nr:tRNA (guanosine(46)-N7)-methyltransferase TrmB [Bacteroidales bacterium]MDD3701225.1 tRNA (guanosine(46)-N7)-methyltransferase TrmB [Bacteroidales bacterium]MDY0368355.1 tRNA (guanosine(46)-N7)-methyltransferase TrmB [Bacteroidales bacterium]